MAVASMYLGVWSWSRQSPELQTECENGRERRFKQVLSVAWLLVSEYFTICSVTGIFTHNHF